MRLVNHHSENMQSKKRGNILITVLWVLMALIIIVMGLSFEARGDVERAMLYRDRTKAYWLARAAVERVKFDWAAAQVDLINRAEGGIQHKMRYEYEFEGGSALCLIITSTAKMNINSQNRDQWKQLFKFYGLDEQQQDEVADAILDWRDPDDLTRLNGAEAAYYQMQVPPYLPRNGPFFSIEELTMVRGITEAMFYGTTVGGQFRPGLQDMLSNNAMNQNRFDINSCPKGILMAFLEIDELSAQQIINSREEKTFENIDEVSSLVNLPDPTLLNKFFMTFRGMNQAFTIRATGYVEGSPARYTIEDEVRYIGGSRLYNNVSHKDFSLDHVDETILEEEQQ